MMTNVNGHAALPALQVCPPATRADVARRDLRRRARQVRQQSLEAGQRRRLTPPVVAERAALNLVHTTVDLESLPIELAGKPKGTGKVERRKRRPKPTPPARPESNPVPVPGKPAKAPQKAVTAPQQPALPGNPEQAAASGKRKPGRKPQPMAVSGTKKETVLALLRRPLGATLAELMQATGWLSHSVRGFLSGALRRKMGLKVRSSKRRGVRVYSLRG